MQISSGIVKIQTITIKAFLIHFFFHHICLSIENKNIIVSDKDTHKCQNNCSPQLANC